MSTCRLLIKSNGGYNCVYHPSNIFHKVGAYKLDKTLMNSLQYHQKRLQHMKISFQCFPVTALVTCIRFSWGILSHVIHLEESHASENI